MVLRSVRFSLTFLPAPVDKIIHSWGIKSSIAMLSSRVAATGSGTSPPSGPTILGRSSPVELHGDHAPTCRRTCAGNQGFTSHRPAEFTHRSPMLNRSPVLNVAPLSGPWRFSFTPPSKNLETMFGLGGAGPPPRPTPPPRPLLPPPRPNCGELWCQASMPYHEEM
jgi:hypothetical protein